MEGLANSSTQPDRPNNLSPNLSFELSKRGRVALVIGNVSNYVIGGHGSGPEGGNHTLIQDTSSPLAETSSLTHNTPPEPPAPPLEYGAEPPR